MNSLFKDKRGASIFTIIFYGLVFIIIFFLFAGEFLGQQGAGYVQINGNTGIEAMFFSNINMFVLIIFFIALAGYSWWAGSA